MLTIKRAKNQNPNTIYCFKKDFYKSDCWELSKHDFIKDYEQKQIKYIKNNNNIISFLSHTKNKNIVNELKFFLAEKIESKKMKLTTVVSYIPDLKYILCFIEKYYKNLNSIINITKVNLVKKMKIELKNDNLKIKYKSSRYLNSDMEYKKKKKNSLRISILQNLYDYIYEYNMSDNLKEELKDVWDIRKLNFKIKGFNPARPRYTINFSNIKQVKIKRLAKKYIKYRLQNYALATCLKNLICIKRFSQFLSEIYPEIENLTDIDRDIIEDFYIYLSKMYDNHKTKQKIKSNLKIFFKTTNFLGLENAPREDIILSEDVNMRYPKYLPKYIPEIVINQLNKKLYMLPDNIARMTYIIQNIGIRISELCCLKTDCLYKNEKGEYNLKYYQHKTRSFYEVPISKKMAKVILAAINYSQNQFGRNISYVFSKGENKPVSVGTFSYYLNKLAKEENIVDKDGKIFRFKSHHFRGYVATYYLNNDVAKSVIAQLLGHANKSNVKRYAKLQNKKASKLLQEKGINKFFNKLIDSIGKDNNDESNIELNKSRTYLNNGFCKEYIKTDVCHKETSCYCCGQFIPDPQKIDFYKDELEHFEKIKSFKYANKMNINMNTIKSLKEIIANLSNENEEVI